MPLEAFTVSEPLTMGVELELQLLDTLDYHSSPEEAAQTAQRSRAARRLNIAIGGGGTHAFQHWSQQQIFPTERFHYISELYGYLAKQFTVFGQHVHIGVPNGDEALWLLHALSRYVPHFIALSASSPFVQGVDTGFHSARLNSVFAFPLSGRAPFVLSWDGFGEFFKKMTSTGVVQSMKDFYWDIRPKPEFGTIELRVCDTPLNVDKAAVLACYLQSLCRYLREERPFEPSEDDYLVYTYNRFQACRFGLDGEIVDPKTHTRQKIRDDIIRTLARVAEHALDLRSLDANNQLRDSKATTPAGCARCNWAAHRCRRWSRRPARAG